MSEAMSKRHAIFLDGPIGVGKSSLGRELAAALGGTFIDGDDHADPNGPWYCSILRTSRSVVERGLVLLNTAPIVVIAYPLGCTTWIYYRRRFGDAGVATHFVGLHAAYTSIVDASRGRAFNESEKARIRVMISEGYGERPFEKAFVATDATDFQNTLSELVSVVGGLMESESTC